MSPRDDSAEFFSEISYGGPAPDAPEGVGRDQWGRPLILAPDGSGELVAYQRASTMAGYVDNTFGLNTWQKRLVAQGLSHRKDLVAMAASLPPYDKMKPAQKQELEEIVQASLEVAKAFEKANHGTAVHAFTDPTHISGPVPEELEADVRSHDELMEQAGIIRLASEVFVVSDELKVAGTLDMVVGVPALEAMLVGDTKTGKQDLHKTAIQVAIYRDAKVYDPETGVRMPLEEYVQSLHEHLLPPLHPRVGLYVHIPRGEGKTTLHPLNLDRGRYMARLCAEVRDWHKSTDLLKDDQSAELVQRRNPAAIEAITAASNLAELRAAANRFRWCWNDRIDAVGQARWAELGSPTS